MKTHFHTRRPAERVAVIAVDGDLDVSTAPRFRETLLAALDRGATHLIVDLSSIRYVDSTGLGAVIGGLRRASERGGTLEFVCPGRATLRVLEITGFARVLRIHPSEAEALQAAGAACASSPPES
jgi:anti-sigma B factor antagonist